jgi:hypothetical protein
MKDCLKYLVVLLLLVRFSFAQQSIYSIEEIIENLVQSAEEEGFDFDTYFETFSYYSENPLDINKASKDDLINLKLLTERQAISLLQYLEKYGDLITIYELQAVPYFDLNTIYSILPFVKVKGSIDDYFVPFSKLLSGGQHQIFFRYIQQFPLREGYLRDEDEATRYLGSPSRLYFRYRHQYGNKLSYGITGEKDAGEQFFRGANKQGFDFYSAHFFYQPNKLLKSIALGDYEIRFGQGLVMWSGFGFNKSPMTVNVKKESQVLRPYTSVNEYLFLRGAAATFEHKNWQFTPFVSAKKVSANIGFSDTLNTELERVTIQVNGFHRTPAEIAQKNSLWEIKTGANLQYRKRTWHVGLNTVFHYFDKPIIRQDRLSNNFQFSDQKLWASSIDYNWLYKSFHFFGENALSVSESQIGTGFLNGVLFNPDKNVDFAIVHRFYDKKYQTINFVNAFAESTTPNGEHGIYMGTALRPLKAITISAYADIYKLTWLKFRSSAPAHGVDLLTEVNYKPKRNFEMYVRYKYEDKMQNTSIRLNNNDQLAITNLNRNYLQSRFEDLILNDPSEFEDDLGNQVLQPTPNLSKSQIEAARFITHHTLQRFRWNLRYTHNKTWTFQTRAEFSFFNDEINQKAGGVMLFQDIRFNPLSFPLSFSTRFAVFDINRFNAAIYAYENDILYQFSIPAFNNQGARFYLNIRYKATRFMDIWFRVSQTYYTNLNTIGSGIDRIDGNKLTEIKAQVRFRF